MDFGIDRVIEMFETRFGRTASVVLLGLVGLAAAGLAIHIIIDTIIVPLAGFAVVVWQWMQGLPLPSLTAQQMIAPMGAALAATGLGMMVRIAMRQAREAAARAKEAYDALRTADQNNKVEIERLKQQMKELGVKKRDEAEMDVDKRLEELSRQLREAADRV